jgi:glycosyltransferase involved in cell wall biosynthesis
MLTGLLSVVIPAYNEADRIMQNVGEVVRTLQGFAYDFEVILVDDGSSDSTSEVLLRATFPHACVRLIHYVENRGKGHALLSGARYAIGEYILFLDADLDLHPDQIPLFLEMLAIRNADVVVGSKWHPLSNVQTRLLRRMYSRAYYTITRLLFDLPVRDTQVGMKIFRRQALRAVIGRALCKRFAFDLEALVIINRLGFSIVECPITLKFVRFGSRINLRDAVKMMIDTAAIFYRASICRYYDVVDVTDARLDKMYGDSRELTATLEAV